MSKNKYKCIECETVYHTSENTPPPTPRWSDGHECKLKKERTNEELEEIIKTVHSQCKDGILTEHWIGWKSLKDLIE
jgi:hypothetical protein